MSEYAMSEHVILIEPDGITRFVWDDSLADLDGIGTTRIERASHVEPTADGRWEARLVNGPTLGPFRLRSEALAAERKWLRENRGL